jgi:hypothetical protein
MARITNGSTLLAFADSSDVVAADQRVFEANEGLTLDAADDACIAATSRILLDIQNTAWWRSLFVRLDANATATTAGNGNMWVPAPTGARITGRQPEFRDLCVSRAMAEFLLPQIADFGNPESAERQKMAYYQQRYDRLFQQLIDLGDWYDWEGDGTITLAEKQPQLTNFVRVR